MVLVRLRLNVAIDPYSVLVDIDICQKNLAL